MEGTKVIDKKNEVLFEEPTFNAITTNTPHKLKPIVIEPLPLLVPEPGSLLPEKILSRLGVKK